MNRIGGGFEYLRAIIFNIIPGIIPFNFAVKLLLRQLLALPILAPYKTDIYEKAIQFHFTSIVFLVVPDASLINLEHNAQSKRVYRIVKLSLR